MPDLKKNAPKRICEKANVRDRRLRIDEPQPSLDSLTQRTYSDGYKNELVENFDLGVVVEEGA